MNDDLIISRDCHDIPKNSTEQTCYIDTSKVATIVNVECSLCNKDSCNNAGQFTSTIAFIATSVVTAYILSA